MFYTHLTTPIENATLVCTLHTMESPNVGVEADGGDGRNGEPSGAQTSGASRMQMNRGVHAFICLISAAVSYIVEAYNVKTFV